MGYMGFQLKKLDFFGPSGILDNAQSHSRDPFGYGPGIDSYIYIYISIFGKACLCWDWESILEKDVTE